MRDLFDIQREFTDHFLTDQRGHSASELTEEEKLELVKEYVLHLHQELSSILGSTSYKMHRKPMDRLVGPNILEEIVDTVKFSLGLWHIVGGSWEDFERVFREKSEVVSWRYKQDKDIEALRSQEVAILDIDGVLAQYPRPMLDFMEERSGIPLPDLPTAKEQLGLVRYEELKEMYRLSGVKASLPIVEGAKELIEYLRSKGHPVILISARPYERYLRILTDTLSWAKKNGLVFDALYFDEEKSLKIARRFPRVHLFIDDSLGQILDVHSAAGGGFEVQNTVLLDPSGSKEVPPGVRSLPNHYEVIRMLERDQGEK